MIIFKELERLIIRAGKRILTWERDEDYNYISDSASVVKFPRYTAVTDKNNNLSGMFEPSEIEKILFCEKQLHYYFMQPPKEGEVLQVCNSMIQIGAEAASIKKIINLKGDLKEATKTNLFIHEPELLTIIYCEGEYRHYKDKYFSLFKEDEADYWINESGAVIIHDSRVVALILPFGIDKPNEFLK